MKRIMTRMIAVALPLVTAVAVYCVPANTMVALAKTIQTTITTMTQRTTAFSVSIQDWQEKWKNNAKSNWESSYGSVGSFVTLNYVTTVFEHRPDDRYPVGHLLEIIYENPIEVITYTTVPDDDYTVNEKVTPQTSQPLHIHDFQSYTLQSATETTDEIIEWRCACGQVSRQEVIAGSSGSIMIRNEVEKFMQEIDNQISNAPQGGNVVFDTDIFTCFNRRMLDVLKERSDVSLTINYTYKNVRYTVTIPAGYDVDTLLDENGYCGFRYLDLIFAGHELVEE